MPLGPAPGRVRPKGWAWPCTSALVWQASYAAFTGTTRNSGNNWSTGSVALTDDDAGAARFQVENMVPGQTDSKCIEVTANASVASTVKGYAINALPSAVGLENYVKVSIEDGAGGNFGSCAGFVADGDPLVANATLTLGFESSRNSTSATYDRHLYMRTDGRLVYGYWSSLQTRTIATSRSYNDGAWHHLVLTADDSSSSQAAIIYVDGTPVVSGTTTATGAYSGWWRFGYGSLPAGGTYLGSSFYGDIDEAAVYPSVLSAQRVAAHYAASR